MNKNNKIPATNSVEYIGSHELCQLGELAGSVTMPHKHMACGELVVGDTRAAPLPEDLIGRHDIDAAKQWNGRRVLAACTPLFSPASPGNARSLLATPAPIGVTEPSYG